MNEINFNIINNIIKVETLIKNNNDLVNNYDNYLINIYDNDYLINYINSNEMFITNIHISFKGYYNLFTETYIYGKVIYDSLIYDINDNHLITYEINIFPQSKEQMITLINKLLKYYQGIINNVHFIQINNTMIYIHQTYINNLYELFTKYQNILELSPICKSCEKNQYDITDLKDFNDKNKNIYNICLYKNKLYTHPLTYFYHFKQNDRFILNNHFDLSLIHKYFIVITEQNITNEYLIKISSNIEQLLIIFKLIIFQNKMNYIKMISDIIDVETFIKFSKLFFYMIKHRKIEMIKIFDKFSMNLLLNENGFNMLEYSIILYNTSNDIEIQKQYYNIILFLNNYKYLRSSFWIEYLYNSKIFIYDKEIDKDILNKIKSIGKIKNTFMLNIQIIDLLFTEENYFDNVNDFIKFNIKFINQKMLIDSLVHHGSTITFKKLIFDNIIPINVDVLIALFKLNIEDLNNENQKKIFKIYADKIFTYILNNNKICEKVINNKYLSFLPKNFIINNNNDNICHLLCNIKYLPIHSNIMLHVLDNNINSINLKNNINENCIFNCVKENNLELFSLLINFECNILQKNNKGNYLIHELIIANNLKMLELLYIKSKNKLIIDLLNDNKESPIILAAKNKNINIINFLYQRHCDLNIQDMYGNYIFHYIALYGLKTIIKNENKKNNNNYNVTEYALSYILKSFD